MPSSQNIINAKNVSRRFVTPAGYVDAVKNASFSIPEGSFTIIYGPSGSGKTTLLNMLIGLDAPTGGNITYEGKDMYSMPVDSRAYFRAHTMGMVQQTSYWVKSLTVVENVALPLNFLGMDQTEAHKKALESLKRVGMDQHAKKLPSVLSGGEQQRVAMARALVNEPTYIVADEPTGNLDSKNGDALISLLKSMNQQSGRTIVLVTHNLEYLSLGDQLLLIEDGVLTETRGSDIKKTTNKLMSEVKSRFEGWETNEK